MGNWFECKICFKKVLENGLEKTVTESYIVNAMSFSEAEAKIIRESMMFISGEFEVSDIKKAKYSEIFFSEMDSADRWFKVKLQFITLDEKTGVEKRTSSNVLVNAADLRDAVRKLDESMKSTMADYVISSVAETAIMDVYPYKKDEDNDAADKDLINYLNKIKVGEEKSKVVAGKVITIQKMVNSTVVKVTDDNKNI